MHGQEAKGLGIAVNTDIYFFILLAIFVFVLLVTAIRILREYERAVVFTLGRFERALSSSSQYSNKWCVRTCEPWWTLFRLRT